MCSFRERERTKDRETPPDLNISDLKTLQESYISEMSSSSNKENNKKMETENIKFEVLKLLYLNLTQVFLSQLSPSV